MKDFKILDKVYFLHEYNIIEGTVVSKETKEKVNELNYNQTEDRCFSFKHCTISKEAVYDVYEGYYSGEIYRGINSENLFSSREELLKYILQKEETQKYI